MDISAMTDQEKKDILDTLLQENPALVKDWVRKKIKSEKERELLIEKMILEDFQEYDEVFKALA